MRVATLHGKGDEQTGEIPATASRRVASCWLIICDFPFSKHLLSGVMLDPSRQQLIALNIFNILIDLQSNYFAISLSPEHLFYASARVCCNMFPTTRHGLINNFNYRFIDQIKMFFAF